MLPRPPKATPTDTRLPSTTLFRASPTGPPTRLPPRRRPPRHRRRSRRSTTFRLRPSTPNDGRAITSPPYLAIDTPHLDAAQTLAQKVRPHVGGPQLGREFFWANGHHGVHDMAKLVPPIFLDLKLHDIPTTVAKAITALRPLEPPVPPVHPTGARSTT